MNITYRRRFSLAERIKIVHEYETSDLTLSEISAKYGIRGHSVVETWRRHLQESKNNSTFVPTIKSATKMSDPERQEKDQRIAELERKVHQLEMRNLALNTLIDIAEEQGIQIRKKSGAKQ